MSWIRFHENLLVNVGRARTIGINSHNGNFYRVKSDSIEQETRWRLKIYFEEEDYLEKYFEDETTCRRALNEIEKQITGANSPRLCCG